MELPLNRLYLDEQEIVLENLLCLMLDSPQGRELVLSALAKQFSLDDLDRLTALIHN